VSSASRKRSQRVGLRDTDARVPQQPHDDAVVMRALRVEKRVILVRAQEVVRALRARGSIHRARGVQPPRTISAYEELRPLEIREEHSEHSDRPSHRRGPREMAVAYLELCLPVREVELEVGGSQVADGSGSKPVGEASERVRVLATRRGSTAPSTQMAIEALEKRC